MQSHRRRIALLALLGTSAVAAWAQRGTEMFVPIAQSPGLSGKVTVIGTIESLNAAERSMTVKDAAGASVKATMVDQTRQWLDRSALGQPTRKATAADYRAGMTVELKFRNNDRAAGLLEWIKLKGAE